MRIKSPCQMCGDRELKCHASCERYKAYRKELDEIRRVIIEQKEKESRADCYEKDKWKGWKK